MKVLFLGGPWHNQMLEVPDSAPRDVTTPGRLNPDDDSRNPIPIFTYTLRWTPSREPRYVSPDYQPPARRCPTCHQEIP